MTQASVLRTSSTGSAARRTRAGYHCFDVASWRVMRSPTCTRACWMWRGFLVSCKYSVNCWSESLRPNHVFHQNRKGMRQTSLAVTKKGSVWVRDMPGLGRGCKTAQPSAVVGESASGDAVDSDSGDMKSN